MNENQTMTEVTIDPIVTKLAQMNLELSPEVHYRWGTVFSRLEGISLDEAIRVKFDLVKQIEPVLQKMLLEHEQVLFVSKGDLQFKKTVMVLTNLRLLCVDASRKGEPRQPNWAIYYSQIDELKSTVFRHPKFCLKDGMKLSFNDFPKHDRQTLHNVFQDAARRFQEEGLDPEVSQSRENLCGNCFEIVSKQTYECDVCGATFWTPFEFGVRSFLFPPWLSFILRPSRFAYFDLVCYAVVVFSILLSEPKGNPALASGCPESILVRK
ncbi:hypothetical protein [uncultured Gimesia sp.]|uniref:hypothetical protein n=1 Tax=uncultured Gimesia sp. TaxID=1678688 RepID=UPI00263002B2|nr:hypothetical protein [uncultured Gimesia sp.]